LPVTMTGAVEVRSAAERDPAWNYDADPGALFLAV
jgi:hypothetical protein